MAKHQREAKVYFAMDGEEGYYIGSTERPRDRWNEHERYGKRIIAEFPSTHDTRYCDEYELIEFAEGMGIPLTNSHRKRFGDFREARGIRDPVWDHADYSDD
jgi:hypothetical protein